MKKLFNKQVRISNILLIIFPVVFIMYYLMTEKSAQGNSSDFTNTTSSQEKSTQPNHRIYRSSKDKLVAPLLMSDISWQSTSMNDLKQEINWVLEKRIANGQLQSASVYIRKLNSGNYISIQEGLAFNPGSLIKVPVLITYLKESEKTPSLLDKQILFEKPRQAIPHQTFAGRYIEPGKKYSVRQLLEFMIAKSDNYATHLLNENMNISAFQELFTDLGMPQPDVHNPDFTISASDYSKFLRLLYNGTYLTVEHCNYALTMLSQSDFSEGLVKDIPKDFIVSRKFGEFGTPVAGTPKQLHESGIFYFEGEPVLVTVMTKGPDVKLLPSVLSAIGKTVYDHYKDHKAAI